MCERYLPIHEKKLPGVTWPRQILGDLDAWSRAEREGTPDGPDESDSADALYHSGFPNLLVGYHHRDDPACLTAGVCGTIIHVIHARAQNVFLADAPVVVSFRNVAFDAVYRRERAYVAAWLRAEAVWKYPEPTDMEAMMHGLERWEARECCPMGPERAEPESSRERAR